MDVPCNVQAESVPAQYIPPAPPRSHTTLHGSTFPSHGLEKRKSLRLRPMQAAENQHAAPPTPLNENARQNHRPELRPRTSKMSLFSLFSKPKVEKLRGYAEQGLDALPLPSAQSGDAAHGPKDTHVARSRESDTQSVRSRPFGPKHSLKAPQSIVKEPPRPITQERNLRRPFDPPPLFQVWPQAVKHGTLEVPNVGSEQSSRRLKTQMSSAALSAPHADRLSFSGPSSRASVDASRVVKSAINYVATGTAASPGLCRKKIVLVTSGYILQYADEGRSDRLPEKMLQLGRDSAAYASDMIPGKHHVLQIVQSVEQSRTEPVATQSFLSRLGLRNQTIRREPPCFLLVMAGPEDMNEWMTAVRQQIESHGGKRARSDSSTSRPRTSQGPSVDLHRLPSHSHRYRVKRDPEKPFNVPTSTPDHAISPGTSPDAYGGLPQQVAIDASGSDLTPATDNTSALGGDHNAPIADLASPVTRPRTSSNAPSISSSTSVSIEQQQLDKLRDSAHLSRASTTATSVAAASRANSVNSSPCEPFQDISETGTESSSSKTHFRTLASYNLAKRRSAAPLSIQDTGIPLSSTSGQLQNKHSAAVDKTTDSPTVGFGVPIPESPSSPPKGRRLSAAKSAPDLKSKADRASRIASAVALASGTGEKRPESFLADLPSPATWARQASPSQRTSITPFPPLLDLSTSQNNNASSSQDKSGSPTSRPLRSGSNSFSRPLRTSNADSTICRSPDEVASDGQHEKVMSPVPVVTTLPAKVDPMTRTTINQALIPARHSSNNTSKPPANTSVKRTTSARLSLFPVSVGVSPTSPPPSLHQLNRQSSGLAVHVQASSNGARLARPASLQVRTSHAPFLASMRTCSAPNTSQIRTATTAPIRSLKPSRSVATMQLTGAPLQGPTTSERAEAATHMALEAALIDDLAPLPQRSISPLPTESTTGRKPRMRVSLPHMDFGMSLAALGPPAPPPSVPLPAIPTASRPQSPETLRRPQSVMQPRRPVDSAGSRERAQTPSALGLGIKVGDSP